jgi:hypothetical protein
MGKLNTTVYPLTEERYLSLTQKSPKSEKAVQCEPQKDSPQKKDVLRDTPWKQRGERLLCFMTEHDMHWDDQERLVLGFQTVIGSHMPTIIKDVCSEGETPIGSRHSRDFFKLLVLSKFDFKYGAVDT